MHLFLEGPSIDRSTGKVHRIPGRGRDQDARGCPGHTAWLQRTAQMRDIRLHRGERSRRRLVGIKIFDEPVGGDHLAVFGDQPGEHGRLPRPADVSRGAVDGDLERAEHPNRDHGHLTDKEDHPTLTAAATGPQVGGKSATSAPAHAGDVTTTPLFAFRTRTTREPEPDLTLLVVTHRAIRQDLRRLEARLAEIAGRGAPPSRARAIGRYTAALFAEILRHHETEDDVLWPVIAATAGQAVDLTPLTADPHATGAAVADGQEAMGGGVGGASQALASFRADPGTPAELHAPVTELRDMLDEHIADEEQQILPAMRRYLPAEAYRWCEKQTQRNSSLAGLRFTAPWLARYAQPDELSRLLAAGCWPVRILLAATRPGYARLERRAFGARPARP